jgi:hypothetical protein
MKSGQEITYAFDFHPAKSSDCQPPIVGEPTPRIARLMALAIRFEGLVREKRVRDYADLARRGHVTRARMAQIMKLLDLAPDLQEEILFLPPVKGLTERRLRLLVTRLDWREQRRLFQQMVEE